MSNLNSGTPAFLLYHLGHSFFFSLPPPSRAPPPLSVIHLIPLLFIYSTLTVTLTTLFILLPRSCCINSLSALYESNPPPALSPSCPLALLPSCPLALLPYTSILPPPHFPIFPISLFPHTLSSCPLLFFTLTASSAPYS